MLIVAADLDTDKTYVDINYDGNISIIIGNEAMGLIRKY